MVDIHERRISILRRVESGELSLEDGNRLLLELEERSREEINVQAGVKASQYSENLGFIAGPKDQNVSIPVGVLPAPAPAHFGDPSGAADPADPQGMPVQTGEVMDTGQTNSPGGWRGLWVLPFLSGLFLTMISINWMYLGWAAAGLGWGFWLSFLPLGLGIVLMWVGWELRLARWLHLRIRQARGNQPAVIAFSLPLPMGLTRWAVQRFGKYSPRVNGHAIEDFLDEFDQAIATDGPMHVYVGDENGAQVEIWVEGPKKD